MPKKIKSGQREFSKTFFMNQATLDRLNYIKDKHAGKSMNDILAMLVYGEFARLTVDKNQEIELTNFDQSSENVI